MSQEMRILLLTNEYPPHIYGGAGVHVEYLARELATLARPRGITHFSATVLAENAAALAVIRKSEWPRVAQRDGPVIDITATIAGTDSR